MSIGDRKIQRGCCTWCSHDPHELQCATSGCPCAYRKK